MAATATPFNHQGFNERWVEMITGWWFQIFFNFHPYFGEDFQFDCHIFQMGWFNHQPVFSTSKVMPGVALGSWTKDNSNVEWTESVASEAGGFRNLTWRNAAGMWRNWCEAMIRFLYISLKELSKRTLPIGNSLVKVKMALKCEWVPKHSYQKIPSIWYQSGQFRTTWAKVTWNGGLARQSPPKMALHQFPSSFDV